MMIALCVVLQVEIPHDHLELVIDHHSETCYHRLNKSLMKLTPDAHFG